MALYETPVFMHGFPRPNRSLENGRADKQRAFVKRLRRRAAQRGR
jgi:hypothetical protein